MVIFIILLNLTLYLFLAIMQLSGLLTGMYKPIFSLCRRWYTLIPLVLSRLAFKKESKKTSMKRKEQLAPLSREHHQSLVLAKKCIDIGRSNDMPRISTQCRQIVQKFDEIWESHFEIEEQTLFKLAASYSQPLQHLCDDLAKQHQLLREMKQQMQQGNFNSLETFGIILKKHTRTEERELFPQVEQLFSQKDLNEVLRVSNVNNIENT